MKKNILFFIFGGGGSWGALMSNPGERKIQGSKTSSQSRHMYNKATRSPEISREQVQKLTPQFLLYIYILDIDSHCP